jgi:predicted house-cleaning NTP pyrophosphatase (Maf/HAM1 superfamily)
MNTESISLILASNSPRRAFLLKECGFEFKVRPTNTNEDFDPEMDVAEIPKMLAAKKTRCDPQRSLPPESATNPRVSGYRGN